jgi:hypothetical protein
LKIQKQSALEEFEETDSETKGAMTGFEFYWGTWTVLKLASGSLPFTTCSVTGPTHIPSPSFLLAQAIFEPNFLPYGYHNNSQI